MVATVVAPNYVVGKGSVYVAAFGAGTQTPGAERFIGNAPMYKFSAKSTMLDHFSSTSGVKLRDDSTTLEAQYGGSFDCDNVAVENLGMAFLGSSSTYTDAGSTTNVDGQFTGLTGGDRWIQLGVSITRPEGARTVTNVLVRNQAATSGATTYTANTDYVLDAALGRVYIIPGGAIDTAGTCYVGYDVTASFRKLVVSGNSAFEGTLRFISNNPKGFQRDYFFPWAKVTPNGDYDLIGDEYQKMSFDFEALTKTGYQTIYAVGRTASAAVNAQ